MAASEKITDIKSKGTFWILGVLASISVLVLFVFSQWWGREPQQFNILESAISQANPDAVKAEIAVDEHGSAIEAQSYELLAADLPLGYTYTATLAHIADTLLNKALMEAAIEAGADGFYDWRV